MSLIHDSRQQRHALVHVVRGQRVDRNPVPIDRVVVLVGEENPPHPVELDRLPIAEPAGEVIAKLLDPAGVGVEPEHVAVIRVVARPAHEGHLDLVQRDTVPVLDAAIVELNVATLQREREERKEHARVDVCPRPARAFGVELDLDSITPFLDRVVGHPHSALDAIRSRKAGDDILEAAALARRLDPKAARQRRDRHRDHQVVVDVATVERDGLGHDLRQRDPGVIS